MALSILTRSTVDDSESHVPDDILANELFGEASERHFRPSLADRLQIGFLRSDHATQTEDSEIPEIKSLTSTVQELVTELGYIKKDLHFSKRVITAKYNKQLEDTTLKLHTQLQEKITEIERLHEERVNVARRSFKQQLQDALIKMSEKYKKYYEDKLAGKLKPTASTLERKSKVTALETEVERCQSIIEMLEIQVEDLRKEIEEKDSTTKIIMDTEELDAANEQNDALQIYASLMLQTERQSSKRQLQAEINQLTAQVDELSDSIEFREEKIRSLNRELADSREEADKEREMSRKLAKKVEELKSDLEKNHASWKSEVDKMKSSLQENMAGEMKKQMDAQKSLLADQEKAVLLAEKEKQKALEEERRKYELLLVKERENTERVRKEANANKAFEASLEQQRNEVAVLKNRLARTNKQWEKKFTVLRSSLHALKDESYVRQQLQKQSATLKYASISYGTDFVPAQPQSAVPLHNNGVLNPNKPLPGIRGNSGKQAFETTNTLPSGPGTEIFATGAIDSADEQEMEEYVRGFVPLPSPPNWQKHQFGEYMPSIDQHNATS